jgi:hypothetical protein
LVKYIRLQVGMNVAFKFMIISHFIRKG